MDLRRPAVTSSHRVLLRTALAEDYGWLYQESVGSSSGWRWRHRGSTPHPDAFVSSFWSDALVVLVAERVSDGAHLGYLSATRADFRNGHCYVSVFIVGRFQRTVYAAEAAVLFMTHVMRLFPFRKLYFEIPEFNSTQIDHAIRSVGIVEGRLLEYEFCDGRYWDSLVVSVGRSQVETVLGPLVRQVASLA